MYRGRRLLVTVGTTQFNALTNLCQGDEFINVAKECGITRILIQVGHGEVLKTALLSKVDDAESLWSQNGVFRFSPILPQLIETSDYVISHCGAGTTLEALTHQKPLCIVSNPELMNDHQTELGEALGAAGYATYINGLSLLSNEALSQISSFLISKPKGSCEFVKRMTESRKIFQHALIHEIGCLFEGA
eukprot:Blabericola_migrator_1__9372@NODE_5053_length_890_cov_219_262454_g3193_i0_p1_GENE_NODE_5053_length_890_cov_219_262454_g3193_i0NODE_5053_length_890_cov_219_262454_g3193_i0_p1_ORF_typecomplete_len190_score24_74Glyco_tran_28_C/PF04101_16/5_4e27UDPGT/PF00201_18/0_00052Glyco_trans_1_3/PF13528_6/0_027_NODE_5053_length_890_cov_219_262454_g3193_i0144713